MVFPFLVGRRFFTLIFLAMGKEAEERRYDDHG